MESLQTMFDEVAKRVLRFVPPLSVFHSSNNRLDVVSALAKGYALNQERGWVQ